MNTREEFPFKTSLAALLLLVAAFPLYQLATLGLVFYRNGLDEGHYLVYEISKVASAELMRPSQKIVSALHEAGFSGGLINLLFDLGTLGLLLLILINIFRKVPSLKDRAGFYSLLFVAGTLLFGAYNPLIDLIRLYNRDAKLIYWLSVPDNPFFVFARTPEPQFSYLLIFSALYMALSIKRYFPLFLVLPLLYNFLLIPVAFAAAASAMRLKSAFLSAISSFIAVSIFLHLCYSYLLTPDVKGLLVETHLPLISFTGLLSAILHLLLKDRLASGERRASFILCATIWQTANTQIICGILAAPSNYEQYFGVIVLSFQFVLFVQSFVRHKNAAFILVFLILILNLIQNFTANYQLLRRLPPNEELLSTLKENSHGAAFNNLEHSLTYSLIYPRQPAPILSYAKIYFWHAEKNLEDYLCAKDLIHRSAHAASFAPVIKTLDAGYASRSEDNPVNHLFRKNDFRQNDISRLPSNCAALDMKLFIESAE